MRLELSPREATRNSSSAPLVIHVKKREIVRSPGFLSFHFGVTGYFTSGTHLGPMRDLAISPSPT